jgi:hypothetical protein
VTLKCSIRRRSWLITKKPEVEGKGGDSEEVHGRDGLAMITKKCPPTPDALRISGCASHPAGEGPLGYRKAQHAQFAMNAWSAPGCVLGHHFIRYGNTLAAQLEGDLNKLATEKESTEHSTALPPVEIQT